MKKLILTAAFLVSSFTIGHAQSACGLQNQIFTQMKSDGYTPWWVGLNDKGEPTVLVVKKHDKEWATMYFKKDADGHQLICMFAAGSTSGPAKFD